MAAKEPDLSAAAKVKHKKPLQEDGGDGLLDYYDILVIGRTGMGKSTTVDKILIAKLPGMDDTAEEEHGQDWQEAVPNLTPDGRKLRCCDMIMWLISDERFSEDKVSMRLKNLVFFRSVENSHKEINTSRDSSMHIYESTTNCELLSNETTKIRVLDVPGFFGRDAVREALDLREMAQFSQETDLGMMRKVLRIKCVHCLNFKRVIYFLPEKGSLKRTSGDLILEIGIMEKYFGRAIFDNMVVVATMPSEFYEEITNEKYDMFSNVAKFEETKRHLQEAICRIFRGSKGISGPPKDLPEPPLIFISLFDTCEAVLQKVQQAQVKQEQIQLELSQSICSRCGAKIFKEGKEEAKSRLCASVHQSGLIAEEESTCHPMLVPKYSEVVKILGGIAHLITLRRFIGRWPSFESMDEACVSCQQPPSSHGCVQVGGKFLLCDNEIIVQHSTSVFEPYDYQIEVVNDGGTSLQPPPASAAAASQPPPPSSAAATSQTTDSDAANPSSGVCNQRGGKYFVYHDGRVDPCQPEI